MNDKRYLQLSISALVTAIVIELGWIVGSLKPTQILLFKGFLLIISIRIGPIRSMNDDENDELRRTIEEMQSWSLLRHGILQCEIERIMDLIGEQAHKAKVLEDEFTDSHHASG